MPTNAITLARLLLAERQSLLRRVRRLAGADVAEDVVQKLWFKVQSVGDDPPIHNPRAYLHRLAVNAATDEVRASARQASRVSAEIDDLLWVEDASPLPDHVVIARDMLGRIRAAMDALPEPTREMFRLNRMEGVPQREIAARFGVSTTIVERHIARALKHLSDVRRGA